MILLLGACGGAPEDACPAGESQTTVFVVRHADRDNELLNDAGHRRAEALRDLVAEEEGRLAAVLYTPFERTRQTVAPALEWGKESGEVSELQTEAHDYAAIAGAVGRLHAGGSGEQVIVVAGHSDSVRPILEQFGQEAVERNASEWFSCEGQICSPDYDDVWLIELCGTGAAEITKSNYGADTPDRPE